MDVHTVISLNVSVGIAPILKSDNVWQLRQQTHFIPRCRGSWTSRTSRSSRQAPVGLGRFQYEVVMTRDSTHTHTNKDNRLLFATGTHSRNIFCWDLPKHIVVWLCDGFARVFSIEWLRGQLTTTTYRFLPCEAPGKLLMSRSWSSKMLDLDEVGLHRPFFS